MIRVVLKDIVEKPITGEWGDEGTSVNVLRTTNFTNEGFIDYSKVVKRDIEQKKIDTKRLHRGDIIIEKSGGSPTQPVGRVVYFDSEEIYLCNNFTAILRPKKEQVFPKYLQYILFVGHQFGLTSAFQNKTTGIINLQLPKYLEGVQVPLPPLPQQQKIANILDAADALRQNDKALIAKYDELTQALFLDMFGDPVSNPKKWEIKTLSEVCNKITDGTHQGPKFIDFGIPFLLVSNIVNNEINFNTKKYISEKEYSLLTKSTPIEKGDLLYTSVGSYGNPAIVKDSRKFCFQRHIAHLKPKHDMINIVFLHAIMASPFVTWQADRFAIGVAQKTLNLKVIKSFKVFLPSLDIQNQFAERVAVIEEQKAIAQKSLEQSESLFNSLLQKAFKGELV